MFFLFVTTKYYLNELKESYILILKKTEKHIMTSYSTFH